MNLGGANPLTRLSCISIFALIVSVSFIRLLQVAPLEVADRDQVAVVDLSPQDLLKLYPTELGGIAFEDHPEELNLLLNRAGENVERFFDHIRDTTANEQIMLQVLDSRGRIRSSTKVGFNYLLLAPPGSSEPRFQEQRADSMGHLTGKELSAQLAKMNGYMVTSGFAAHCVLFHPRHQSGSRFRYLGRQVSGPGAHLIAFAQIPERGDFLIAVVGRISKNPVLVQGLVWVDAETYQISRMITDLLKPDRQNGITKMRTDVKLSEVRFADSPQTFWLPHEVIVTLAQAQAISVFMGDPIVTFRNTHRYSNYKLFRVEVRIKY